MVFHRIYHRTFPREGRSLFYGLFFLFGLIRAAFSASEAGVPLLPTLTLPTIPLQINTPTPALPAPTPTPVPVFDLSVVSITQKAAAVIHSITGQDRIEGSCTLQVENSSLGDVPIVLTFSLINPNGVTAKTWVEKPTLTLPAKTIGSIFKRTYSLAVVKLDALTLGAYTLKVEALVDETRLPVTPFPVKATEFNLKNNTRTSDAFDLLHLSGMVYFGQALTTLTGVSGFSLAPFRISGTVSWNFLSIPINNIAGARHATTLDLVVNGGQASFAVNNAYRPAGANWSYTYANGSLTAQGVMADLSVVLPDGVAYRNVDPVRIVYSEKPLSLGRQTLTNSLRPVAAEIAVNRALEWMSEGNSFVVEAQSQTFSEARGIVLNNAKAIYRFDTHVEVSPDHNVISNDAYYLRGYSLRGEAAIRADGLEAAVEVFGNGSSYTLAYPRGSLTFDRMWISVKKGKIVPDSSFVEKPRALMNVFASGCGDAGCPDSPAAQTTQMKVEYNEKGKFYSDGSLLIDAPLASEFNPSFNSYTLKPVTKAVWYQPGNVVRNAAAETLPPSAYLQGMRSRQQETVSANSTEEYYQGTGLFAGINVLPEALSGKMFSVRISQDSLDLQHSIHSKLNIRRAGVTGIVHAGLVQELLEINRDETCDNEGYQVELSSFGQSYLDNRSINSVIHGEIHLDWPQVMDIPFRNMDLDACGQFTSGVIPPSAQREKRLLAYWMADLYLLALEFREREDAAAVNCVPTDKRTLWLTSRNPVANLSVVPKMEINIKPCGLLGENAMLDLARMQYDGYDMAFRRGYLSQWDRSPEGQPFGFYNILGKISVPVFDELSVQAQVRATASWVASGAPWFKADGRDPDADRDGWDDAFRFGNVDKSKRNANYSDKRPVPAETRFADMIPLAYDLEYNPINKRFKSKKALEEDLIVLDIISSVDYLNRQRGRITFGVEADIMADVGLNSLAEDVGRYAADLQNTFLTPVRDRVDFINRFLSGDLAVVVRPELKRYFMERSLQNLLGEGIRQLPLDPDNPAFNQMLDAMLDEALNELDLPRTVDRWAAPVRGQILGLWTQIDEVREALHLDSDDLQPLVNAIMNHSLEELGISVSPDVREIVRSMDASRAELAQFLDGPFSQALDEVEQTFDRGGEFLENRFFTPEAVREAQAEVKEALKQAIRNKAREGRDRLQRLTTDQLAEWMVDGLFNSGMFRDLRIRLDHEFQPIDTSLFNYTQNILDTLNEAMQNYLRALAGVVEGIQTQIKSVTGFRGASLKGEAIINSVFIEQLHIGGEFTLAIPHDVTFAGYLDMHQQQIENNGEFCGTHLDGERVMDVEIGVENVPVSWMGAEVAADIHMGFMLSGGTLANIGGGVDVDGIIDFEMYQIIDPQFHMAIGRFENYLMASAGAEVDGYSFEGGFFFGKSCTDEPLRAIDAEIADLLELETLNGIFVSAGGSFPIVNAGCVLRVSAEGGMAVWYFTDSNTFGGRLKAGIYGRGLCVVNVKGELILLGSKVGDKYTYKGSGWVAGGGGWCERSRWSTPRRVLKDDWCYACVMEMQLTYKNGWSVEYDSDCG